MHLPSSLLTQVRVVTLIYLYCCAINKEACDTLTCTCSSTNRDQMSPILCNGFDWQLVLGKWSLLHNGDSCQRSCLRALDDATDSTYRRGCNWRTRLHGHYGAAKQNRLEQKRSLLCHWNCCNGSWSSNINSPLISWCSPPPFSWVSVLPGATDCAATVAIATAGIWWTTCTVCITGAGLPAEVTMAGVAMV